MNEQNKNFWGDYLRAVVWMIIFLFFVNWLSSCASLADPPITKTEGYWHFMDFFFGILN